MTINLIAQKKCEQINLDVRNNGTTTNSHSWLEQISLENYQKITTTTKTVCAFDSTKTTTTTKPGKYFFQQQLNTCLASSYHPPTQPPAGPSSLACWLIAPWKQFSWHYKINIYAVIFYQGFQFHTLFMAITTPKGVGGNAKKRIKEARPDIKFICNLNVLNRLPARCAVKYQNYQHKGNLEHVLDTSSARWKRVRGAKVVRWVLGGVLRVNA